MIPGPTRGTLVLEFSSRRPVRPALDPEVRRLTEAVSKGDPVAVEAFYRAWFDRAYRLARSLTGRDESFCLDVVQDAMLRVVRSLPRLDRAEALERWMARTVHATAIDRLRREARRARHEARSGERAVRAGAEAGPAAGEALEVEEEVAWLRAQLARLDAVDGALLRERFERGKTLRAAGRAVGMTGHAAHGRIRRVIARLRAAAREVFGE